MHQLKNSCHDDLASQFKKTSLAMSLAVVLGGISTQPMAALSTSTLSFTLGEAVTSCNYGTTPPCNKASYSSSDIVGSYFSMDSNKDGNVSPAEKTGIGSLNGIIIGTAQAASGSHSGSINGTENPNIDQPWEFFGNTGMHQTLNPVTVTSTGATNVLDMSGWNVTWNALASIPLLATSPTTVVCDTAGCSNGESYTLDGAFHVTGAGFTSVAYTVHLEGTVLAAGVPPLTQPDTAKTIVGNPIDINVLANDSSADGLDTGSVAIDTPATTGTATPNPNGTVNYDPLAAIAGDTDTFTYTVDSLLGIKSSPTDVDVSIQANLPPLAVDDLIVDGRGISTSTVALDNAGGSRVVNVLGNDTDPNNNQNLPGGIDPATVTVVGQPSTGTCTANPDGTITYAQTPPSVAVTSTCTYQVFDIDNSEAAALSSNIASVEIEVSGIQSDWDANLDPAIIPVLQFDPGVPDPSGNTAKKPVSGTYFSMDVSANTTIYTTLTPGSGGGMIIGHDQIGGISHTGLPTGNEVAVLDLGWNFFGNTGMTYTKNGGIVGNSDGTLEFKGTAGVGDPPGQGRYIITWNGIPAIDLGGSGAFPEDFGFASINCDAATPVDPANTALCADGDFFELDYAAHVPPGDPSGFGGVQYALNMTGKVRFMDGRPQTSDGWAFTVEDRLPQASATLDTDMILQCIGDCFDFTVVTDVDTPSVSVVLPLAGGIPKSYLDGDGILREPVLRVFRNGVWDNFITSDVDPDSNDTVKSAAMVAGGDFGLQCPAPGDDAYGALTEGHQCIEVTIQDNGLNDKDPELRTITDPSGIGLPAGTAPVDNRTSGNSGCSMSGSSSSPSRSGAWWLMAGFVTWLGWNRRRLRQH